MCVTKHFKLHYWPGLTFGLFIFTFLVTYLLSVLNGHVYGFFPYISDTGTLIPESCIFGQLFNFGALAMGTTMYIRYRQVDFGINSGNLDLSRRWNTISLWLAGLINLGISLVGNFQETGVMAMHFFGANLAFGFGSVYFLIQTKISYSSLRKTSVTRHYPEISRNLFYLRLFLSVFMVPLLGIVGICGIISRNEFKGKHVTWWTEKDGGFQIRLASTFTEWILVIFMLIYILTYTNEFKSLEFDEIRFINRCTSMKNEEQDNIATNC